MDKPRRHRPTVSDVARRAGVSDATVSRTFNIPDVVRKEVRQRVISAAEKLGYTPNPSAKALRLNKTHLVAAAIPSLDYAIYARLVHAFQSTLASAGYMTVVLSVGFDNRHLLEPIQLLVGRGAEALLLVGKVEDEEASRFLQQRGIPVIDTYSYIPEGPFPSIGIDNYIAARQVIDYLLHLGHRALVMIAGVIQGNDRQQSRVRAFNDAATASGVASSAHVLEFSYSIQNGAAAMHSILMRYPETTAVICNSDILAFGVLVECKKRGIKIPRDLSIAGFDDEDFAAALEPALTTVSVPAVEMGERAAKELLHALTSHQKMRSFQLETSLIIRGSTSTPFSKK